MRGSDILEKERLILFTGHYGSGKTELSINYAIRAAEAGNKVVLVDLDIVNPFFRSSEVKDILETHGVKVISPNFALTSVDVPSLPAEIFSVFVDKSVKVVFDIGGDEVGARVLGRFFPYFQKEAYRMFYVISIKRPLSSIQEDILEMLQEVESKSRLKVTDLINNSNLSYETQEYDIIEGQELITKVSQTINIPITYIAGMKKILDKLSFNNGIELFPLDIYMTPPW